MTKEIKNKQTKEVKTKKTATTGKAVVKKAAKPRKKIVEISLLDAIVAGMQEKKAHQITVMDMRALSGSVCDYFVICHGTSTTQAEAIARSIEEEVYKLCKINPSHVEGVANAEWILLDYFDIIAHVFIEDKRMFYGLERLWGDAEIKQIA